MDPSRDETFAIGLNEIMHGLICGVAALDKAVAVNLQIEPVADADGQSTEIQVFHRKESLYRILDWKLNNGQLTLDRAARILGIVVREVDRFRITVQNFSGAIAKDQRLLLKRAPTRINAVLEDVISLFEYVAIDKGLELRKVFQEGGTVVVDPVQIYRVFSNILDNAIKYSYYPAEKGGARFVLIESRRHSVHGDWIVSFQSYGVGIDKEEIDTKRIFEYGYRGKAADDRGRRGTGIGLAEARRIIAAHKGDIDVESRKLEGDTYLTSFKVILRGN